MVRLFLSEPNWKEDRGGGDSGVSKQWILLLNQLESVIWSLMTSGGRAEARLWLCNTIAGITSITSRQQRDLFVNLLRTRLPNQGLASQLLQMIFEKRPQKAGPVIAERSYVLEKFFEGNPKRIMQWFSNFAGGGGLDHKKGAKALSQFAFVNRDICWEELEWKGKHGQSPAVVATKPHYFLDLDVQRTIENFLENVPEFWSSSEFAESLRDGDILSIDTKYFVEFFVGLMYKEDSNVWDVISEFLMEESFSSLCNRLLISLEERELLAALELLHRYYSLNMEPVDFGNSSCWLDFVLSKFNDCESLDQLLLLNAVTNQGRQLLRLVNDEESQEEQTKIKDIVSQICTISSTANSLVPFLKECFKMKTMEATKFLGLQSWVIHYALSEENWISESWESLFSNNGISFRKSDKYAMLHHDGLSEENDSELDDGASVKRKHRKKKKSRKKRRRNFDDDDIYDNELLDLHASNSQLELQTKSGSWLLSTDGFSASWTNVDLPEHLSKFCFSVWMKWVFAK
ncbi:hypothetical protein P3X46_018021 [Hevea brasiliensis]|uniref:BTB domain-containing protein n=1 Tax=Hevea brasiliensis TaxID=3981 RepID=A0ABQ9LRG2_HEVBR|nr:uncharacterized protein LOC110646051 [Hevea brasiliensis]KAJ9169873.1 hypothetical protein P3X46_018021 [Hevea brasiliensis]